MLEVCSVQSWAAIESGQYDVDMCDEIQNHAMANNNNQKQLVALAIRELKQQGWWQLENVTQKVNSCCFKLYPTSSNLLKSSNVDNLLWS